jgi:hypothetical protein
MRERCHEASPMLRTRVLEWLVNLTLIWCFVHVKWCILLYIKTETVTVMLKILGTALQNVVNLNLKMFASFTTSMSFLLLLIYGKEWAHICLWTLVGTGTIKWIVICTYKFNVSKVGRYGHLCVLSKHSVMCGKWRNCPYANKLCTGWRRMLSLTSSLIYCWGIVSSTHWLGGWVDTTVGLDSVEKKKICAPAMNWTTFPWPDHP